MPNLEPDSCLPNRKSADHFQFLFLAHSIYKLFWSNREKKRFKELKSELEAVLLHEKDTKG